MKYYSEVTGQVYSTIEDLKKAETEVAAKEAIEKAKKEERAKRAKEVDAAFEEVKIAQKKANELLKKFTDDYGSYHTTIKSKDCDGKCKKEEMFDEDFFSIFNSLFPSKIKFL